MCFAFKRFARAQLKRLVDCHVTIVRIYITDIQLIIKKITKYFPSIIKQLTNLFSGKVPFHLNQEKKPGIRENIKKTTNLQNPNQTKPNQKQLTKQNKTKKTPPFFMLVHFISKNIFSSLYAK